MASRNAYQLTVSFTEVFCCARLNKINQYFVS